MFVAVLELSADPREAVPAPDCSIVHFAETINAACPFEPMRHSLRRVVRFADYLNHQSVMLTESVSVPLNTTLTTGVRAWSVATAFCKSGMCAGASAMICNWSCTGPLISSQEPDGICMNVSVAPGSKGG